MRKKKLFAVVLAVSVLISSGYGQTPGGGAVSSSAAQETPVSDAQRDSEETDYSTGTPWMDSNIDGNVTASAEVDLKDDFYLAVNKDAILEMEYSQGEMSTSLFETQENEVEDNMMKLITEEGEENHEIHLLKTYYSLLDDWEARESLVRERIARGLEQIEGFRTIRDYVDAVYDWNSDILLADMTQIGLDTASDDASVWIASCYGSSLTLSDSAEYSERTDNGEIDYETYKEIYQYACEQLGLDTSLADAEYDRMIEFEAGIAKHTMTSEETMRAEAAVQMDNYMSLDELDALLGENYDLKGMLEYNRFVPNRIKVPEPEQLRYIGEILSDEANLEDIKNYCKVKLLLSNVSDLSREAMTHVQEITAEKRGSDEITAYEKKLLHQVCDTLNTPMQIAYVKRYGTEEMREEISALCREVAAEYREMLENEDWLSEETKAEAIKKLDTLTINSLYPDKWDDFSTLDLDDMDLYEARLAIRNYDTDIIRSYLNSKVDQELWYVDVTEVNAYYFPNMNSINIMLGIAGGEFYSSEMSREEKYGKIGSVIAHEISHAFDSYGGQFDSEGNMISWWNEEDLEEFNRRVEKVRAYYDEISIYGDKKLTGSSLDGEATADIAGVQCVLRLAKKKEDFDYDKLFRSYAEIWCSKYLPYVADYLYIYDPHPPEYLRANVTLQQFDEFLETYDIREGDGMYLAPEDRIIIW